MKDLKDILYEASLLGDIETQLQSNDDAIKDMHYVPELKDFKKCTMYGHRHETWYIDWNIDWWIKEYKMDIEKYWKLFRFPISDTTKYILRFVLTFEDRTLLGKRWSLCLHVIEKDRCWFKEPESEDRLLGWLGWNDTLSPYLVKGNINKYKQNVIDIINILSNDKSAFVQIFEHANECSKRGYRVGRYDGTFAEPDYLLKNLLKILK